MRRLHQHWTESYIILASREGSVWRNKKAQKEYRFLRGRQIAYLSYEYFRVNGANDSVENYADLFTIALRNDDIQEFNSKWDGILLSMTKMPSDDILEGLYKLRIRESQKLKTVLELYDLEIHQMKAGPDFHRLKTRVKRSIEQNLRNRNFGIRNGNSQYKHIRGKMKSETAQHFSMAVTTKRAKGRTPPFRRLSFFFFLVFQFLVLLNIQKNIKLIFAKKHKNKWNQN